MELLYDTLDTPIHKWEPLESISGTYDQDIVKNEMAELKFARPVHIKVEFWKISFQFHDFIYQCE